MAADAGESDVLRERLKEELKSILVCSSLFSYFSLSHDPSPKKIKPKFFGIWPKYFE